MQASSHNNQDGEAPGLAPALTSIGSIGFDEALLDATLEDAGVATDLPLEGQRMLAASLLSLFSLAMAVHDDTAFESSLERYIDWPTTSDENAFFDCMGRWMLKDLYHEFSVLGDSAQVFILRVQRILRVQTQSVS